MQLQKCFFLIVFKQHIFKIILASLQKAMHCFTLPQEKKPQNQNPKNSCNTKLLCCTHQTSSGEGLCVASQPYTFLNLFSMPGYWNQWKQYPWMAEQTTSFQPDGLSLVTQSRNKNRKICFCDSGNSEPELNFRAGSRTGTYMEWQRCSISTSPESMIF